VQRVAAAIRSHPRAAYLLDGAEVETSLFWRDRQFDVPCKARLDARNHGGVFDIKTARDASRDGFSRAIGDLKYHLQAAFYINACEHVLNESPRFFGFVAAEKEPPYAVACYFLDGASIMAGARWMNIALERYREALESGKWTGYPEDIQTISVPRYALRFHE
jgi:hypothetical protein